MPWLPAEFVHPLRLDVDAERHLRPIRATDVDLDMVAVMGSQARLWSIFGPAWEWPPASMTREQDRTDLARHQTEIEAHESFNYAFFDEAESTLLGCVYIDPPKKTGADAEICWWVVNELVGTKTEASLDEVVPRWITTDWPFENPRYIGRDISWAQWLELPDAEQAP